MIVDNIYFPISSRCLVWVMIYILCLNIIKMTHILKYPDHLQKSRCFNYRKLVKTYRGDLIDKHIIAFNLCMSMCSFYQIKLINMFSFFRTDKLTIYAHY